MNNYMFVSLLEFRCNINLKMEDSPSKKRRKATFKEVGPSLSKDELIRRLKVGITFEKFC